MKWYEIILVSLIIIGFTIWYCFPTVSELFRWSMYGTAILSGYILYKIGEYVNQKKWEKEKGIL